MVMSQHQSQRICLSEDLRERGLAVCYQVRRGDELVPAFVFRYQQRVYSYLNSCAHLKMEMDWTPGQFFDRESRYLICATHGALFEPESGLCVSGPCFGRSLTPIGVQEIKKEVFLKLDLERMNE